MGEARCDLRGKDAHAHKADESNFRVRHRTILRTILGVCAVDCHAVLNFFDGGVLAADKQGA